jgi:tetratricopeptide (TPR) repeat protein
MLLRQESSSQSTAAQAGNDHSILRVYRRHAARALSEERWEVAEIFFDRILDVSPNLTEAWLMKGLLRHYCREDDQAAIRCYKKVLRLCGDNHDHPHARKARASLGRLLNSWG